jgi:glyoxylase-like metal-dependent hydrolase (beta-lactamase superfamily II)
MPEATRRREVGRGERVVPGVWRLRLPLPWPGVPHGNAWALAAGDGIVMVDTGMHEPGSMANLERAMAMVNLRLEHVRLLVVTHGHSDHYGQAGPIVDRAGCELWMHADDGHIRAAADDPEVALAHRLEIARTSGIPEEPLRRWAQERRGRGSGVARFVEPDRHLVEGMEVETDLGVWRVVETPGHAPSHVCLHQPERRLLISGDHLLGRVSPYYEYGYTPDPAGEFLHSLDKVDRLDARLCLSGHGKPFTEVHGRVQANRALVGERLDALRIALRDGPLTASELAPRVYGEALTEANALWWLSETLCYLTHLEVLGEAIGDGGEPARWASAADAAA